MSSGAGLNATRAATALGTPALWLTGTERWLLLVGLSVALGGLAGRGLARQYLARDDTRAAPARLPPPWALRGSLAGLVASAALLVTVLAAPGAAATLARPPAAGLGGRGTAVIAAAELACFAVAALLLRLRRPGWSVAPLSGVVLAEGLRAHPEGMIPVAGALLTYCHLLPAVLWAGMLVYTARTAIAWRAGPAAARGLFRLYGTAAAWLFGIVVVTGVLSAVLLVPVSSLLTTTYGRFLVAKAALVAAAAALALASRARLRRPAPPGTGLPLAVRLEIAALAAVLAATGLLTVLPPRRSPSSHRQPARPSPGAGRLSAVCAENGADTIGSPSKLSPIIAARGVGTPYRRPAKYRDEADNMRAAAPAMSQPILASILLTIVNPPFGNLIQGRRFDAIPAVCPEMIISRLLYCNSMVSSPWVPAESAPLFRWPTRPIRQPIHRRHWLF